PSARTVLDVAHDVHWGWKVSAYLVTKGIAAGAAILAPLVAVDEPPLGGVLPELIALLFLLATVVLLIADLKRPMLFFRLLTRPNTKSWLVKGGFVLTTYGLVVTLAGAARLAGAEQLAEGLRFAGVALGVMVAIYTAFLFAQ